MSNKIRIVGMFVCLSLLLAGCGGGKGKNAASLVPAVMQDQDGSGSTSAERVMKGTELYAGANHTCTISYSQGIHSAYCWGNNAMGQLGNGTSLPQTDMRPLSEIGELMGMGMGNNMALGTSHTCIISGLMPETGVKCWGANNFGQLGDGTTTQSKIPVAVAGISGPSTIAAGANHTCALEGLDVKCWGANNYGQLGNDTLDPQSSPVQVAGLPGGFQAIAAGANHTCAVTMNNTVKCWGANINGQLGDGTITMRKTPVDVVGLSGIMDVVAGMAHTCARNFSGNVWCWGANTKGQLGDGTTTQRKTPVEVMVNDLMGTPQSIMSNTIVAGSQHTCVKTQTETMMCWGANNNGQLGDGTTTQRNSPVEVTGLSGTPYHIAAGGSHTCATVNGNEYIKCWGLNTSKQLGNDVATQSAVPVDVTGVTKANVWINIPAGKFVMGAADNDTIGLPMFSGEEPKHTVTLSAYKIQKYEVTNAQYELCVDAGICSEPSEAYGFQTPTYRNAVYANHPVRRVYSHMAAEYCEWIGGRLPTEAEWEKAARGPFPREVKYPWGNDEPTETHGNFNITHENTVPVGSYPAGASYYKVMDMAGNVAEWVSDRFAEDYYTTGGPWVDPKGPQSGMDIVRGGSWQSESMTRDIHVSGRRQIMDFMDPEIERTGFRCAQGVDTQPPGKGLWSPAKASFIPATMQEITFITSENANCRWALTDLPYSSMTNDCMIPNSKNQNCMAMGLVPGVEIVYIACSDSSGNADTAATNEHVNYVVDVTPPGQKTWSPAKGAVLTISQLDINFYTTEKATCRWSLEDIDYLSMYNDCWTPSQGEPNHMLVQSCHPSNLVDGPEIVYIACQDLGGFADTAETNEHVNYLVEANNPWITIPAGTFTMGCATGDLLCQPDESPRHVVTLPQYNIQKYEVTMEEYYQCVQQGGCQALSSPQYTAYLSYGGNYSSPVSEVTWDHAAAYCAWAGGRLPTEAEWEKAARGPGTRVVTYPWGTTLPSCSTVVGYSYSCSAALSSPLPGTHPLGKSFYGVMDMAGSMWEWVSDWHSATYYSNGGPTWNDPQGPLSGTDRVVKGGGGETAPANVDLRISRRGTRSQASSFSNLGFRCAKD